LAAFFAKKMMKMIKRNKDKELEKPIIFDRNICVEKVAFPSDTNFPNFAKVG
jgi:hypothetical protein